MYGKIENGTMTLAPSAITIKDTTYINPSKSVLSDAGYVPLQFTAQPNGGLISYDQYWDIIDGIGIQHWIPSHQTQTTLQMLVGAIERNKPTVRKIGQKLQLSLTTDGAIVWQFVPDENYKPENTGTFIDPIQFVENMSVVSGLWYTDGQNIWQCIQNGVATDFSEPWFEIITI